LLVVAAAAAGVDEAAALPAARLALTPAHPVARAEVARPANQDQQVCPPRQEDREAVAAAGVAAAEAPVI
jgi:hypothetical protein